MACHPLGRGLGPGAPGVQSLWCQSRSSRPECPVTKGMWWAATGDQAWRWGPGASPAEAPPFIQYFFKSMIWKTTTGSDYNRRCMGCQMVHVHFLF